jgi:hypothetical protein
MSYLELAADHFHLEYSGLGQVSAARVTPCMCMEQASLQKLPFRGRGDRSETAGGARKS